MLTECRNVYTLTGMRYKIYEANFRTLVKRFVNLNQKLARIKSNPVIYRQVGFIDEALPSNPDRFIRYIELEIDGETQTSTNGWQFMATVTGTEEGSIISSIPGYEVPADKRDATGCDHCRVRRQRNDTYIVRHEDGRVMQVGSSCLADFVGSNWSKLTRSTELLLNAYQISEAAQSPDWLGGSAHRPVVRFDLMTYLSHVANIVLKEGRYITRKQEREGLGAATAGRAVHSMQWANAVALTPEAEKMAEDARAWVVNRYSPAVLDPDGMSDDQVKSVVMGSFSSSNRMLGDFEHNLLSCARHEVLEERFCGIAAYIIEAYRRTLPQPGAAQLNKSGLTRIFQMFETAKPALKHPTIRLADQGGSRMVMSLAGDASKNKGAIYVKGDRASGGNYYGKITPEGRFFRAAGCPVSVEPKLVAFAADPETVAANYGKLTGCCCFCGRSLSDDRSTDVGYGPVCAAKFGLNWGTTELHAESAAQASAANLQPAGA